MKELTSALLCWWYSCLHCSHNCYRWVSVRQERKGILLFLMPFTLGVKTSWVEFKNSLKLKKIFKVSNLPMGVDVFERHILSFDFRCSLIFALSSATEDRARQFRRCHLPDLFGKTGVFRVLCWLESVFWDQPSRCHRLDAVHFFVFCHFPVLPHCHYTESQNKM